MTSPRPIATATAAIASSGQLRAPAAPPWRASRSGRSAGRRARARSGSRRAPGRPSVRHPRDRHLTPRAGRHRRRPGLARERREGRRRRGRPRPRRLVVVPNPRSAEARRCGSVLESTRSRSSATRPRPKPPRRSGSPRPHRQRPVLDDRPVGRRSVARRSWLLRAGSRRVPAAQQRGAARAEQRCPAWSDTAAVGRADRRGSDHGGAARSRGRAATQHTVAPSRATNGARQWDNVHRVDYDRGCQAAMPGLRPRAAVRSSGRSVAALSRAEGSPQSAEREGVGVWTGSPRLPERLPRQCCRDRPTTGGGLCRDTSRGPAPRGL